LLAVLLDRDENLGASRSEKNRRQEYVGVQKAEQNRVISLKNRVLTPFFLHIQCVQTKRNLPGRGRGKEKEFAQV
jgi:hypothetical protein